MSFIFASEEEKAKGGRLLKQRTYQDVQRICILGKSEELANRVTLKLNELIDLKIDQLNQKILASNK